MIVIDSSAVIAMMLGEARAAALAAGSSPTPGE
jgi:uncharacterized protein with PIN domain